MQVAGGVHRRRSQLLRPASLLPDEWMEQSCALGPVARCVQTLLRFRSAGADEIVTYGSTPSQNAALANAWRQASIHEPGGALSSQ